MVARTAGRSTRNWKERVRPEVLRSSDICHYCGHPGADEVDHTPVPLKVLRLIAPHLIEDPAACAPIHGIHGCPYCPPVWSKRLRSMVPPKCNQSKGAKVNAVAPVEGSRLW